jgi:hypothetical protein
MKLHVFRGDVDWVVAYDELDAWKVFAETYGDTVERAKIDCPQTWKRLDDDSILYVWTDSPRGVCLCEDRRQEQIERQRRDIRGLGAGLVRNLARSGRRYLTCGPNGHYRGCPIGWPGKTCRQWCKEIGRGVVASTEI